MAKVIRNGNQIELKLSNWEKIGAFHPNLVSDISWLTDQYQVEDPWTLQTLRGIRAPGTGIPYVIMLGTLLHRKGRDFAAVYKRRPVTIYEFNQGPFKRWIVTNQ